MVEESVIFIVGREKSCFAPDLRVICQSIEDLRDIPGAIVRGPIPVLRISFGGDHPGNLGQTAAGDILAEDIKERSADSDVSSGLCTIGQRRPWECVLVLMEVEERIVTVIANIGVVGEAPELFGCKPKSD